MPTVNPRINVTLSPTLDGLVTRLAAFQRCSKSSVLRELLESAEPTLARVVVLMEAASKASSSVHVDLARSLQRSQDAAEDVLAGALMRIDRAQTDLVIQAQAVQGRRPGRAGSRHVQGGGAVSNPPSSNRGVKSVRTANKAATTPAKKLVRQGRKS